MNTPDHNQNVSFVCMTYNLRYAKDKKNLSVKNRLPRIVEKIKDEMPDLLGVQEAQSRHIKTLKKELSDTYGIVFRYRQRPNPRRPHPESCPILYKKDRFDLLSSGNFWLSLTPWKISKMPEAHNVRICTWVKLKDRLTGREFFYYNLHLDFGKAQTKSIPVILGQLKTDADILVGGDFNLSPLDDNYTLLVQALNDSRVVGTDADIATYHEYHPPKEDPSDRIDYIFYRGNVKPVEMKVVTGDEEKFGKGKFASDHYPVVVKFVFLPPEND